MPTPPPPPTPAENFAALLAGLVRAVVTRSAWGLPQPLIVLIFDRIRGISQRVARLAARIRAGRYVLRAAAAPRSRAAGPRRADPLPRTSGWLLALVPEAVGARAQLENLFRDPEVAALLAAAPVSLSRPLRSLCRMPGVPPPDILAPPAKKPRAPRNKPAPAPAPAAPPRPPLQKPAWWVEPPRRTRWSFGRIRAGPPRPA